jgi:hypothetical protein
MKKGIGGEIVTLNNQRDTRGLVVRDRHFGPIKAVNCGLSAGPKGPKKRSYFENCTFSDVKADRCVVGFPIFRNCVFRNVKTDFFDCYCALFLACKLEGIIDGVNFGLQPKLDPVSSTIDPRLKEEYERLLSEVPFSLDVREAVLANVVFWGDEIVPYVLFDPGQCAIYRGEKMSEKLEALGRGISDRALQGALFGASPRDNEQLAMVALETFGASERVSELREIVSKEGIELIDHPLIRS